MALELDTIVAAGATGGGVGCRVPKLSSEHSPNSNDSGFQSDQPPNTASNTLNDRIRDHRPIERTLKLDAKVRIVKHKPTYVSVFASNPDDSSPIFDNFDRRFAANRPNHLNTPLRLPTGEDGHKSPTPVSVPVIVQTRQNSSSSPSPILITSPIYSFSIKQQIDTEFKRSERPIQLYEDFNASSTSKMPAKFSPNPDSSSAENFDRSNAFVGNSPDGQSNSYGDYHSIGKSSYPIANDYSHLPELDTAKMPHTPQNSFSLDDGSENYIKEFDGSAKKLTDSSKNVSFAKNFSPDISNSIVPNSMAQTTTQDDSSNTTQNYRYSPVSAPPDVPKRESRRIIPSPVSPQRTKKVVTQSQWKSQVMSQDFSLEHSSGQAKQIDSSIKSDHPDSTGSAGVDFGTLETSARPIKHSVHFEPPKQTVKVGSDAWRPQSWIRSESHLDGEAGHVERVEKTDNVTLAKLKDSPFSELDKTNSYNKPSKTLPESRTNDRLQTNQNQSPIDSRLAESSSNIFSGRPTDGVEARKRSAAASFDAVRPISTEAHGTIAAERPTEINGSVKMVAPRQSRNWSPTVPEGPAAPQAPPKTRRYRDEQQKSLPVNKLIERFSRNDNGAVVAPKPYVPTRVTAPATTIQPVKLTTAKHNELTPPRRTVVPSGPPKVTALPGTVTGQRLSMGTVRARDSERQTFAGSNLSKSSENVPKTVEKVVESVAPAPSSSWSRKDGESVAKLPDTVVARKSRTLDDSRSSERHWTKPSMNLETKDSEKDESPDGSSGYRGLDFTRFSDLTEGEVIGRPYDADETAPTVQKLSQNANSTEDDRSHKKTVPSSDELDECRKILLNDFNEYEIFKVILKRPANLLEGSIGVILSSAASNDQYITVQRVISGSIADRSDLIEKGDRVFFVQDRPTVGMSASDARALIKQRTPDVVFVLGRRAESTHGSSLIQKPFSPETVDPALFSYADELDEVTLIKGSLGVGLALDGGRKSVFGDRPIVIKRIFEGGSAAKMGRLNAGDQVCSIDGIDITGMSYLEATKTLRSRPEGPLKVLIRRRL